MGDVSEDDDFLDVAIMTINAKEVPEEYQEIIQYLDNMRFPIGTTKTDNHELRTRVEITR
jgi:hypothetical protein